MRFTSIGRLGCAALVLGRRTGRERERGQTIPFWTIGVIVCLALCFFVMNYSNDIRWHVRAQNAADTAAQAAVAADANLYNQQSTLLYTLAVDEYRMRYMIQSFTNAALSDGKTPKWGGCIPTTDDTGTDCDNAYDQQVQGFAATAKDYGDTLKLLEHAPSPVPAGPTPMPGPKGSIAPPGQSTQPQGGPGSASGAAFALVWSRTRCDLFDCGFYYTPLDLQNTGVGSSETVDVVTCRNVPRTAAALMNITDPAGKQFYAVGHAAATLVPVETETFDPSQINPKTGVAFQPQEFNRWSPSNMYGGWITTDPYNTKFDGLKVTVTWYGAAPTKPYKAVPSPSSGALACLPS